ncbi:MAG: SCO family protein [Gammaproteobacteria bacterium]|nr:SCO family protein [Gammaproteobacteria bacterium]
MSDGNRNATLFPLLIAAVVAMALGVWFAADRGAGPVGRIDVGPAATVLPVPKALPPFTLRSHDGAEFGNAGFEGKWSFVFFGYTFCPDVCPVALSTFREVKALLARRAQEPDDVEFVFISVDPERDTLERLRMYVEYFDPDFVGVTGDQDQLLMLSRQMGVVYRKVDGNTPEDYLVDHSAGVFLVDPDGKFRAYFPAPHDPSAVADAFSRIAGR